MTWLVYYANTSSLVVPYPIQCKSAKQAKELAHSIVKLGSLPLFRLKAKKA